MAKIGEFSKMVAEFTDFVDFAVVYVEEAHPVDEWRFKNAEFSIKQHASLEERVEAARIIAAKYPQIPVFADLEDNHVSKAFGAFPERLFIVLNNKIVYEGGMGPFLYNLDEVKEWLADFSDTPNNNNNNNNNKNK